MSSIGNVRLACQRNCDLNTNELVEENKRVYAAKLPSGITALHLQQLEKK